MDLFVIEDHTAYYLSIKTGEESFLGKITGLTFLVFTLPLLFMSLLFTLTGDWEDALLPLAIAFTVFPISFLWESRKRLPPPILFNRRTREIYFNHKGELFHTPWDEIEAIAYEFKVFSPHTGNLQNAALEILIRRLGEPENGLMLSLGLPMGKNLAMQKGLWEYLRSYMNNGPWFNEHGNHSESNKYIKEQLAFDARPSRFLGHQLKTMSEDKKSANGKPYLNSTNIILLIGFFLLHPASLIEDRVHKIAKRRSSNQWPEIVLERLRPDGPTTRLIDLERERGLEV